MRAVVVNDNGLQYCPDLERAPTPGEVCVDVTVAGICETDLQLVRGYMHYRGVLGHEFVGVAREGEFAGCRVVGEINCACRQCEYCTAGLANHCPNRTVIGIMGHDGALADVVYVPHENLHRVPESLADDVAVFTEPVAAAFQIAKQLDLTEHSRAAVVGDGRLGYLVAQVLCLYGCEVTVIGKYEQKLDRFAQLGMKTAMVTDEQSPRNCTLAVDCSGSPTGITTAVRWLRPNGILVLKTTTSDQSGPNLASIVIDEITVVGSRCGPFDRALQALDAGEIEVQSLITGRFAIEQAIEAFAAAASSEHRKVLIDIA